MKKHCIALSIFTATFVYSQSLNRPQTPKPPFPYITEDVSFKNNSQGNVLAGTIMTPKNFSEDSPIMVMITGSGMQNRDEEGFGHKIFLVIADNLARKGIATLRLDDRGIGGSEKGKDGPTSQDFAGDVSSAVNFLAGKGFKNIGLLGHSEGGMIAPMVANMNKNVKFLVLLAGPDLPGNEILMYQSQAEGRLQGATEEQLRQNDLAQTKIFNFIKNYQGNNLRNDLKVFMIPEMRKLAGEKATQEQIEKMAEQQAKMASMPWFVYFLKYNPDENLSKIKIPVLALDGSLDVQVPAKENLAAIQKSLAKAGNKNFKTVEMHGLNHLFQTAKTGSVQEYSKIEETFSPAALNLISDWISKLKK